MKKLVFAGALALVILSAWVAVLSCRCHAQREAIISALRQREECRRKFLAPPQGRTIVEAQRRAGLLKADYLAALKHISTDGCPESFRQAWLEYVQAWERLAAPSDVEKREDILTVSAVKGKVAAHGNVGAGLASGLNASGGGSVEADLSNLKDMAKRLESRDTNEAFRNVEVVSLDCGVDALKWE